MPSVSDALEQASPLQAALDAGVNALAIRQQVTFTRYARVPLSQDGFVFWVASGQIATVTGSLHYSADRVQDESETYAANQVLLTSEQEITEFNLIGPDQMWIGSWPVAQGQVSLRVAFSRRGDYFGPANLWHYSGFAVYPTLQSQIVDFPDDIPSGPIVSNSLPIWLAQNSYAPVYPSFLVPDNAVPPYVAAHVEPNGTAAIQAFPILSGFPHPVPVPIQPTLYQLASDQLCEDHVRLSLYGFNNQKAQQFLYSLIEYSRNTDAFGFMSSPAVRDEKRTQREISAIAQKKCIDMRVSYYQSAADVIARRLIVEALVSTSFANP